MSLGGFEYLYNQNLQLRPMRGLLASLCLQTTIHVDQGAGASYASISMVHRSSDRPINLLDNSHHKIRLSNPFRFLRTELNPRPNFPVAAASSIFLESPTVERLLKSASEKTRLFLARRAGP